MGWDYAEQQITKALEKHQGHEAKACKDVIAEALKDPKLLLALAKPHLTGIVAHAVNRVIRQNAKAQEDGPKAEKSDIIKDKDTSEDLGSEILEMLSKGQSAQFARESEAPPLRRKAASQAHIDALSRIIRKS